MIGKSTVQLDQKHLQTLLEIGQTFNSSLELDQLLNTVIDKVIEVLKAERGYMMLVDPETGELRWNRLPGPSEGDGYSPFRPHSCHLRYLRRHDK